jgi:cysteine desulfurase / selenocysteine lyase
MQPRRLYLDNAATSFPKPKSVIDAMVNYATTLGASAGRGAYAEAIETSRLIAQCRQRLNKLFNGQNANHFIFTLNCSDALNIAIKGMFNSKFNPGAPGHKLPHAVCTAVDHNSILRPLNALKDAGEIEVTIVAVDSATTLVDPDAVRRAIRPETKLIALTHASNVTGVVQPIREIGKIARAHDIPFLIDAAQSAGHMPIDVQADNIDLLAAPGHKGLLGPLGTGFLYLRPGMEKLVATTREGGTGSVSELDRQPDFMPDKYEPGSHNAIGIIGLSEALAWLESQTIQKLHAHHLDLTRTFLEGISSIDGLTYYGPQGIRHRTGVFSVAIDGTSPHDLATILETTYGILTRPGLHCAPLAHQAINTTDRGGTTRFSFGPFLTSQDIKYATDALADIAANLHISAPRQLSI